MSSIGRILLGLALAGGGGLAFAQVTTVIPAANPATNPAPMRTIWSPAPRTNAPLVWDAMAKEMRVKLGETNLLFSFVCTNVSDAEVQIHQTQTSCGCTVASLPSYPYRIPAQASGKLDVKMDIRGKYGMVTKTITVATSFGVQYLTVTARIPDPILDQARSAALAMSNQVQALQMKEQERLANAKAAESDRQLVFKGNCAVCHTTPLIGKTGKELFDNACGICHDANPRATMVPDLRAGNRPATYEYWAQWIMFGKPKTLMPAFSKPSGGPLTDEQMLSLLDYLVGPFQKTVRVTPPAMTVPPATIAPPPVARTPRPSPPMPQLPPVPPSLPIPKNATPQ